MIVAGFSLGGETALRVVRGAKIPAHGFVLLSPSGPVIQAPDAWLTLLPNAAARGIRGAVIVGEHVPVSRTQGSYCSSIA